MRILGLDVGTKTVGVAISDKTGMIASSLETIRFGENKFEDSIVRLKEIIDEYNVKLIVIGLPKNMNNTKGFAALRSENFGSLIEKETSIKVVFQDERLTSVTANNVLLLADVSRKKRKEKVDNIAATIILQNYLDIRKRKDENNE